jgi:surface polysaccharide O-acyltransferase-like enzyme
MIRRLLLLNGLAILSVVLFHASGWGFTAMFSWTARYLPVAAPNYDQAGSASYYALRLVEQFSAFSIAAFLFASGFFVAFSARGTRSSRGDWGSVLPRIPSLIIPYLLWSAVILIGQGLQGRLPSLGALPRMLLTGTINPAYYFVPLLIQLYLLAPLLVPLARTRPKGLLLVTGLLQLGIYLLQYPILLGHDPAMVGLLAGLLPKWFFPVRIFWFTLGIVVGFRQTDVRQLLQRIRWPLVAATIGLLLIGLVEWELLIRWSGGPWLENRETIIDGLYSLAVILSALAFVDAAVPASGALSTVGAKSFGIYLVHPIVMEYLARAIYHFAPALLGHQAIFQPLLIASGLGAPLLWMWLVRSTPARAFYEYQFG